MLEGRSIRITWKALLIQLLYIIILAWILFFLEYYQAGNFNIVDYYLVLYCTFFCWMGSLFITLFAENTFRKIEQTTIRITVNILLILVYIYLVVLVGFYFFEGVINESFSEIYLSCTIVTIFVSSIYLTIDYFKLYKEKVKETELLKRLQIENELKILSNQVNPHFLFNSLNTLMAIIPENSEKALHFTECFSNVYRYALQNRENETVALRDEIELVNDYCYLLNIRFGENFKSEIDIPEHYLEAIIPPFVLQLLVENATKHNSIGIEEPLLLKICIENESLVVVNNRNKLVSESNGTGTGLENISKRIKYLTGKELTIEKDDSTFRVSIPLIFAEAYESDHN